MAAELLVLARIVLASAILLLLPGHLCMLALFPWKPQQELAQALGAAGSLGLAISIIIGTFLTKTASGFHLIGYLTVLASCCICFAIAALIRNWPTERRIRNQLPVSRLRPGHSASSFGLPFLAAMGLILTTIAIGEHFPRSSQALERYTEFYLLDDQRLIPGTSACISDKNSVRLTIGIVNQEQAPSDYRIEARMSDELLWRAELSYVNYRASWEQAVDIQLPEMPSSELPQLHLLLFRSGETQPYRNLHLGICHDK